MEPQNEPQIVERIKPGPKPKSKAEDLLLARIESLEQLVSKIATLSGHGNHLHEFGLKMWNPTPRDMAKYK